MKGSRVLLDAVLITVTIGLRPMKSIWAGTKTSWCNSLFRASKRAAANSTCLYVVSCRYKDP